MIISSSILFFSILGIVSSANPSSFNVISANNGFKPSTDLRGSYSQQSGNSPGFHKADIYFKTKMPSLNPDQSGVSKVNCNGGNITLGLNDGSAINQVNNWPNNVILYISDKWKCNGKSGTQCYMVSNKAVDTSSNSVSFTSQPCNISEQSEEFLINVSWVDGGSKKRDSIRRRPRRPRKRDDPINPINVTKKLDLNVLFDEKTGKSSKPNIPLISLGQSNTSEALVCANCFINGEATINLNVGGTLNPLKLTNGTLTVNGNVKVNLDLSVSGKVGQTLSSPDVNIINLPLDALGVANVFNIGPSINLDASAKISASVTGTLNTGGEVDLPNFNAAFTFVDQPNFSQSGFDPKAKSHDPSVGVTISTGVTGTLKPQLAFGLDILNGLISLQTGFQLATTLGADVSVGSQSGCNANNKTHLDSTLNNNLGFFVESKNFPIVNFPSVTLVSACV